MPKKKSQDALAEASGDSPPSNLNGKKLVTQESEAKDPEQLVIWR